MAAGFYDLQFELCPIGRYLISFSMKSSGLAFSVSVLILLRSRPEGTSASISSLGMAGRARHSFPRRCPTSHLPDQAFAGAHPTRLAMRQIPMR
jgi:hypothetical protein